MWKTLANMLLATLAIGLTFFTGSRTLDLLAQWLPANQQIMQWLGLAAFEGGLYFWAFYFVTAAKGQIQRALAFLMVVVCFVSVAVATVTDLLLVGAQDGKLPAIPPTQEQAIVVFVGVVIVLNVAAFLGAKLTHPDKLREMAIQDANDQIHAMELAMIRRIAPSVAVQMAPVKAEQWVAETWETMLPGVRPRSQQRIEEVESVPALPAPAALTSSSVPAQQATNNGNQGLLAQVGGWLAGKRGTKPQEQAQTQRTAPAQQSTVQITPAPSYPFLPTTPRYISTETPIIVVPPFYPAPNQSGNGANQNGNSQK